MGVELLHVDGQTDTTKLTVAFRNFAKALKNLFTILELRPKQVSDPRSQLSSGHYQRHYAI